MAHPPSLPSEKKNASPAPAAVTVTCPVCSREIAVSRSELHGPVACPHCGATLEIDLEGEIHAHEDSRRAHWATGAGLIASLFIHTFLLCAFMVITWQSKGNGQTAEGIEVGVVTADDTPAIASPQVEPIRYEGQWAEMAPANAGGMSDLESLGDPESVAATLQPGFEVGMEMAAGGLTGLEGDFAGLGSFGSGAGGSVRFFGLAARGRKFVYVVDYSGSMNGRRLEDAKAELIRSIQNLPRFAEFYVYFYNNSHQGMPAQGLVRATPENKRHYSGWIRGVTASGGTDPTGALLDAMDLDPDAIWLLSDGEFREDAATRLKERNEDLRVQVHAIAFHSENGAKILQRIARENDGRYRFVGADDGRGGMRTRIHR